MTIATPAVLAFYTDSQYIKFFGFIVTHPKSEKIYLIFEKKGNTLQKASDLIGNFFTSYIISENPAVKVSSSNLRNVEFSFFSEETSSMHVNFFLYFPRSDYIKPTIQDNLEGAHLNVICHLSAKVLLSAILGH